MNQLWTGVACRTVYVLAFFCSLQHHTVKSSASIKNANRLCPYMCGLRSTNTMNINYHLNEKILVDLELIWPQPHIDHNHNNNERIIVLLRPYGKLNSKSSSLYVSIGEKYQLIFGFIECISLRPIKWNITITIYSRAIMNLCDRYEQWTN